MFQTTNQIIYGFRSLWTRPRLHWQRLPQGGRQEHQGLRPALGLVAGADPGGGGSLGAGWLMMFMPLKVLYNLYIYIYIYI